MEKKTFGRDAKRQMILLQDFIIHKHTLWKQLGSTNCIEICLSPLGRDTRRIDWEAIDGSQQLQYSM